MNSFRRITTIKKITTAAITSTVLSTALLANLVFASGMSSIEVLLAPFHWTVNGHEITTGETFNNGTTDVPASVNYMGTTYLPVRVIAEQLGLSVEWDGQAKKAVLVDAAMDDPLGDLPYKSVDFSKQARKGDLLFFTTPARKDKSGVQRIGHVAIYLGDNKILHTFRVGIGVTVTELDKDWTNRFVKAARVIH